MFYLSLIIFDLQAFPGSHNTEESYKKKKKNAVNVLKANYYM